MSKSVLVSLLLHGIGLAALWVGFPHRSPVHILVFPVVGTNGMTDSGSSSGSKRLLEKRSVGGAAPHLKLKDRQKNLVQSPSEKSGQKSGKFESQVRSGSIEGGFEAKIHPEYPRLSRLNGEEGKVLVEVEFGNEGQVLRAAVIESSGFHRLDEAAIAAITHGAFKNHPGSGEIIKKRLSIVFKLD